MKISQLIQTLKEIRQEHGEISVDCTAFDRYEEFDYQTAVHRVQVQPVNKFRPERGLVAFIGGDDA